MSQSTTLILLPQTVYNGSNSNFAGNAFPAASYYVSGQNLQTVTWSISQFRGSIIIQTSIADNPSDDRDWVNTHISVYNNQAGTTINTFVNIIGNFTWLRAAFDEFTNGTVEHIKVSY
jgi:hypothetical protein